MRIGIPKEIKSGETRVAVAPQGVRALAKQGHSIWVQRGAGLLSGWSDAAYRQAGARIVTSLESVYRRADLICKVKEPQPREISSLKKDQVLFTFLHLAGYPRLIKQLQKTGCVAIAYETIQEPNGALPILAPMSEIAGRMAAMLGASLLRADQGGKGLLFSRTEQQPGATVTVIGCGHVGRAALDIACGLGAKVYAVDQNLSVLRSVQRTFGKKLKTVRATPGNVRRLVAQSDLVIGAVLVAGRRAPQVVTRDMIRGMEPGSVLVDVAIDQGGCIAGSRPTTIAKPAFQKQGILYCAIPNLPALVPKTSSQLLAAQVLPHLKKLARFGWERATGRDPVLAGGLNVARGAVVHPVLLGR